MKINWKDRVEMIDGHISIDNVPFQLKNIHFFNIIDSGANAIIIKGKDKELDRNVIIKVWLINSQDFRNKIIQGREESRKIARLNHPRIANVYSSGAFKDLWYYLVMEDLGDITLRKQLKTRPDFSLKYKFWYEIEDGIKHAHSKNIFHGDLHSKNIMIFDNHIKILDFGTSIFNKEFSLARESKLIESLVKEIFNEFSLTKYQNNTFKILKPQSCLAHCSAWVEIMYVFKEFTSKANDDYNIQQLLFTIEAILSDYPLFNIISIIDFLKSLKLPDDYIKIFLDHLISGMQAEIDNQWSFEISPKMGISTLEKLRESLNIQNKLVMKFMSTNSLTI